MLQGRSSASQKLSLLLSGFILLSLFGCGSGGDESSQSIESSDANAESAAAYSRRDRSPPSVPSNLAAAAASSTEIELHWSASTDNRRVVGYIVSRNGTQIGTPGDIAYVDVGLTGSTRYSYTVQAVDTSGNVSAKSQVAYATTLPADKTPPVVSSTSPGKDATNVAVGSRISVTFSEAMNDATLTAQTFTVSPVTGGLVAGTVAVSGNTATFTPSAALAAGTQYRVKVTTGAKDDAGNPLAQEYSATFTTAATSSPGTATLAWDRAPGTVSGYRVYYGTAPRVYSQARGQGLLVSSGTTYVVSALGRGTRYYFTVTSVDSAGNESAYSNEVFKDM